MRTNCVDCLDRTNLAQFFIGKCALSHQFAFLGVSNRGTHLVDHQSVYNLYLSHCIQMGDRIALQYGGSRAVSAGVPSLLNRWDVFTSLTRYYNNNFLDLEKQKSMNIFLGNYTPHVSIADTTDDDATVIDPLDPIETASTYAFQRPAKFVLSSQNATGRLSSPLTMEGKGHPVTVSTSVTYSFPWNIREKSSNRMENTSFGGSFEEVSGKVPISRSVSGDNLSQNSPQLYPNLPAGQSANPGDDRPEERRVIDLWDIENDHYLHLQDSNQRFLAPPVMLNSAKWWEIPLLMWAARRLTHLELSVMKSNQSLLMMSPNNTFIKKISSGIKLPRQPPDAIEKDIFEVGSNIDTSSPTLSHVGSWGDSVRFQKSWKLLSPSPQQNTQYHGIESMLQFSNQRKEIVRGGDDALQSRYPNEFLSSLEHIHLSTLTADEDTCYLTDAPEPSNQLQILRQQLEGKFSSREPYLLPIKRLEGDIVNAARSFSQRPFSLNGGRDYGGETIEDIPADNYQLYTEYCSARTEFEKQAYEELSFPPWKSFLAEVKQSKHYAAKIDAKAKEAWLTNYTVKSLVCGADQFNAGRLLDLQNQALKLKQHEPRSLSKYESYTAMETLQIDPNEEKVRSLSELSLQYEGYLARPHNVQEEMTAIEADALQYGTYFPEQDSGSILKEIQMAFTPYLEVPVSDSGLESHLRSLVEALTAGFVTEDRTRHVRGSNVGNPHKLKNVQADSSSHIRVEVFENTFLARQAIDFILDNIEGLQLNRKFITHHPSPRKRVVDLLNLLLQSGIFHHVVQSNTHMTVSKFQDSFRIYRFMNDEKLRVLNVSKNAKLHACTPVEFSKILLKKALSVYRAFLDGSDNEALHLYIRSSVFESLTDLACDLQAIKVSDLVTDHQKIAFWVNIYNVLEIHAQFIIGGAFSVHQDVYLCTSAYNVGGYVLSLNVIQNGILRGNRRGPCHYVDSRILTHKLFRPLAPDDPRKLLAVTELDVRIHFALLRLTSDDLPNFVVEDDESRSSSPGSGSHGSYRSRVNSSHVDSSPSSQLPASTATPRKATSAGKDFSRNKSVKRVASNTKQNQPVDPHNADCGYVVVVFSYQNCFQFFFFFQKKNK